ncbi:MAG: SDR family oxidoreductase [Ignavibacteriales bacterium]|nr:MAG: SDR family oxidoreductase [Ignavibacteriales bacterium]
MDKNKSGIWVTGASSGIGKAAAKEFARVGCNVFVSARRQTELERLKKELEEEKLLLNTFPCNVASSANVEQTVKKITAENDIHCLINNAGITSFKTAETNSVQEITDIINTNLLGSIYAIKALLPVFIKQGRGTIINVLSVVTQKVFTKSSAYAASKMGLLGYSQALREEVRKYNIRVINIIPGATVTPIWSSDVREKYGDRMMTPENIAQLMVSAYLHPENVVLEEIVIKPIQGDLA